MAAGYVRTMRSVQPEGPYALAGHSFGGLVAFEMARILTGQGEHVEWLGLIDAQLDPACLPRARTPALRHRPALPLRRCRTPRSPPPAPALRAEGDPEGGPLGPGEPAPARVAATPAAAPAGEDQHGGVRALPPRRVPGERHALRGHQPRPGHVRSPAGVGRGGERIAHRRGHPGRAPGRDRGASGGRAGPAHQCASCPARASPRRPGTATWPGGGLAPAAPRA